nr:ATP-binding protein [Hydrogenophaga sp.]
MILGPTGVGKTWLASAFCQQACRVGMTAAFHRVSDLYAAISGPCRMPLCQSSRLRSTSPAY